MKIHWKYNQCIASCETTREADFCIEGEESVGAFFNHIGLDVNEVLIGECDCAEIEDDYFAQRGIGGNNRGN